MIKGWHSDPMWTIHQNELVRRLYAEAVSSKDADITKIQDLDADTKIDTEESSDEDILRFDIGGTEQLTVQDGKIEPTTDNDIDLGASDKEFKDLYIDGTAYIDSIDADAGTIDALTLATGATPTEFSTDTTLGGDSDTAIPTEKAVKAYVDANAGGIFGHMQAFTSSGTWDWDADEPSHVYVKVWGSGGGGGTAVANQAGGGGSGGGYSEGRIAVSGDVTVTVAAGGAKDTAGGTSSFAGDSTIQATGGDEGDGGGEGGTGGTSPGTGSGGTVNLTGGKGGDGFGTSTDYWVGGQGGAAPMGGGGGTGKDSTSGNVGVVPGGGGAGSGESGDGGAGGAGLVIVYW